MEEYDLVAACLRGDTEGFRKIVNIFQGSLIAAAFNILGNREDAEDACQETFIQAFRHLRDYDARRSFKNWIYIILYRRCLDQVKKKRRFRSAFERAKREAPLVGAPASDNPGHGRIGDDVLGRLSPKERAAISLWANDGFTAAEISEVLSCSAATARVALYNARKKIKSFLENHHAPHGMD